MIVKIGDKKFQVEKITKNILDISVKNIEDYIFFEGWLHDINMNFHSKPKYVKDIFYNGDKETAILKNCSLISIDFRHDNKFTPSVKILFDCYQTKLKWKLKK